jgi:hypothetical protein
MRASGQEQVSEEIAGPSSGSLGEAAVPSNGCDVLALVQEEASPDVRLGVSRLLLVLGERPQSRAA